MIFKTPYERMSDEDRRLREIDSESMTVPDQSMSIKDIISRSLAGLPTIGRSDTFYDETEDPDPVGGYDLTDVDVESTDSYKRASALEKEIYGS